MHVPASWVNKILFPPNINDKLTEMKMTACFSALVNRIADLREAELKACHCVEEFHLRRICPLGHCEKLAHECPRLADPGRDLAGGKIFNFTF
jgi:hypothetical protein